MNRPVTLIVVLGNPCGKAGVPTANRVGTPEVTLRPFGREATSPTVVAAIECGPTLALGEMATVAVRLVGEVTVTVGLNWNASEEIDVRFCAKCVPTPVMVILRCSLPCDALLGVTLLSLAGPAVTLKVPEMISPPVVSSTRCAPAGSTGEIFAVRVMLVGEFTVIPVNVLLFPAPEKPKSTVVTP